MPYPYLPTDSITWSVPTANLENEFVGDPTSVNPRELFNFEHDVSAHAAFSNTATLEFWISGGQLPNGLTLSTGGQISGVVEELDSWVDWDGTEYEKPADFVIAKDGSNFGTWGSAKAGEYVVNFTVSAKPDDDPAGDFTANTAMAIKVVNNYNSDRDQFIRDYTAEYGLSFKVDGVLVDANTYIEAQNYPVLSANTGYLPTDPGYIAP